MTRIVTYGIGGFDSAKPNNNIIEEIEVEQPSRPLDSSGTLAALLVVQGVLSIDDAANAVGCSPQDLINEAEGWAAASGS